MIIKYDGIRTKKSRQIVLIRYTSEMTISGKEVDLNDLLKNEAKENRKLWIFAGQPRMRLWIERKIAGFKPVKRAWSASYEAVNWKLIDGDFLTVLWRSASYEAVNWKPKKEKDLKE